jgi:hypothetical protein
MHYLRSHWRGKLPLGITLWVNTVGLTIVISYTELFVLSKLTADPDRLITLTLVSLFITRLIIFPWQLIGLFRAIEHDFIEYGHYLKTRVLQALGLFAVLFTFVYALEVVQGAIFYKSQLEFYSQLDAQPDYQIEMNRDQQLSIRGGLDFGITKAARSILLANPQINAVVLQSRGGQIYEGRGLAKLFTEFGLDTYVYEECSSACATAFIGGKRRYLGTEARLGFHQYSLEKTEHSKILPFYDLGAEQQRDLELFKSHGVDQAFLDRMFDQPSSQIWFPDHTTLYEAQIVHYVIPSQD